jgi:hypothetical protein
MTRTHFTGPLESDISFACLVCLMAARGAELDALEDQWLAFERDGHDDRQQWFEWKPDRTLIRDAVVQGISDVIPQAGRIPLCWDHLAGLRHPAADAAPAPRLDMPNGAPMPRAYRKRGSG